MPLGIAGTGALNEDDLAGDSAIGWAPNLASGGARGGEKPLEGEGVDDVRHVPAPVLGHVLEPIDVVPGGEDDGGAAFLDDGVGLIEVDGADGTELGARPAAIPEEVDAVVGVDDGFIWHRLGGEGVDGLSLPYLALELRRDAGRAFLLAEAASGAEVPVDVGRATAETDAEVADLPLDGLDLGVGHEVDMVVVANLDGPGGEDALGAVEGGEGLGELGHAAANRWAVLDEKDIVAGVGDVEGGLHAGDAGPDDEDAIRGA
jgi:hypothetical protein